MGDLMRRRGSDRAAALVEFAFVVPILTLFLFGIVQFGIAYDQKQSINAAAREGARTGAIPANTVGDIETATQNSFQALVDGSVSTTVQIYDRSTDTLGPVIGGAGQQPCMDNEGNSVVVTATVIYVLTIPFFGTRDLSLEGHGEFRCERTA